MDGETARFLKLRRRLFKDIHRELIDDDICLPDEGALEVHFFYPNYFDFTYGAQSDSFCGVEIRLSCYSLGNAKKYRWRGKTLEEALDRFEESINEWEKR